MIIRYDVVIVGGGHGGAQTAIALRQRGFAGSVAILTDEPDLPYERPPLSKDYLAGRKPFERMLIRPAAFWIDRGITIWTEERVTALDADARQVITKAGNVVGYGDLIWAAGGTPRSLKCPGHGSAGVHAVRNRKDVDRLAATLPVSDRIIVVGGGYIGLETAAVLTDMGKRVTLIEAQHRLLTRVTGSIVSGFLEAEHRFHKVDIRLSSAVELIEEESGRACAVRLIDGERLAADQVIVGIGIDPAVAPLHAAGALGQNGVMVDAGGRTSLPHVYAIGDCALQSNPFATVPIRLESVQNAVEMASIVAGMLCGNDMGRRAIPWFWSHQYEHRLQTIGLCAGYDEEVLHGDVTDRRFSVAYLRDGQVIAVDCVNDPKTFVEARTLFDKDADTLDKRFGAGKLLAAE